ncbi:MAG: hypothetical protein CL484_03040 [Acidobacteria bacterium]|nr:hypothetical protein [Acidobacteriota bacterium]|tara:strand:+ start:274 stop:582 length:309 start_codon:yes stop_codon:yes gene_type:complete
MADKLSKLEKEHDSRMQFAVREIRRDPNLRYFFRQLIALLGLEDGVDVSDTNRAMAQFGRQQAGVDIRAVLMSYDMTLYAELLLEDANEIKNNQEDKDDETE